ncbi:MAG: hypothetical protein ABIN89_05045 [Chitinophagaceae bacterium]
MNKQDFEFLFVDHQKILIDQYGTFIRTVIIKNYMCSIYLYDTFYVAFYLSNPTKPVKSKCFTNLDFIEQFFESLEMVKA